MRASYRLPMREIASRDPWTHPLFTPRMETKLHEMHTPLREACAGSDFTGTGLKNPVRAKCASPRASCDRSCGWRGTWRLVGLPALDADHGQAELAQPVKQDRRHASGLEYDPTTARRYRELVHDRLRCRRRLALANHHALAIENANMRFIHRDVEASEIVHVVTALRWRSGIAKASDLTLYRMAGATVGPAREPTQLRPGAAPSSSSILKGKTKSAAISRQT
jgi:hypothetical protein